MPHCIIEYSQNLEQEVPPVDWLDVVKSACLTSGLFAGEDLTLRALAYKNFVTGGKDDAFVHVTIRMLSGRSVESRRMLSSLVLDALQGFKVVNVSFTVEICEMDKETYTKK